MPNTKSPPKKPAAAKSNTAAKQKLEQQKRAALQEKRRRNFSVVLFVCALLWLFLSIFEGQTVWKTAHDIILKSFGLCSLIWGFMLLLLSIVVALDKSLSRYSMRIAGAACFTLLCGAAIHIFSNDASYLAGEGILEQATGAWNAQANLTTGGMFGALLGAALGKLGKTEAGILIVLILLAILMLLTGTTHIIWLRFLAARLKNARTNLNERAEEHAQNRAYEQEQREQTRLHLLKQLQAEPETQRGKAGKKKFNPPPLPIDVEPPPETSGNSFDDFMLPSLDTPPVMPGEAEEPPPAPDSVPPKKKRPVKAQAQQPEPEEATFENLPLNPAQYRLPPIELLTVTPPNQFGTTLNVQNDVTGQKLIETLNSFNVSAEILAISRGPSVTRYELEPKAGIRISRITQLADDIALRLAAAGVRIEAPIPNKSAIGIEVPNKQKSMVGMREIIGSDHYRNAKSKLNVALGKDITGNIITADLAKMPHLLIAGTTGSGKSVCMNSMITSILYNATPDEIKLIMIDPKQVEFTIYNGIAHLLMPVVADPRKAAGALGMAVNEMTKRYKLFSELGVRDITGYNNLAERNEEMRKLEKIVIFIDELSDLMMIAPNEVEDAICRLAQMARAAGMHLVIATQRPSVDVITGIIKANIPSRIALSVSSQIDSRTILDMSGAEKLLGNGDMLFNPVGFSKPIRVQGCFISDGEVEAVTDFIRNQASAEYDETMIQEMERNAASAGQKKRGAGASLGAEDGGADGERDELYIEAVRVVAESQIASTTLLQKKLKLGYARASRIMDELEEGGVVGPFEGSKPRKVLITKQQFMEMHALGSDDFACAAAEGAQDAPPFDIDDEL